MLGELMQGGSQLRWVPHNQVYAEASEQMGQPIEVLHVAAQHNAIGFSGLELLSPTGCRLPRDWSNSRAVSTRVVG